jgi:hypothetical protein
MHFTSRLSVFLVFCLALVAPQFAASSTFTNFTIPGAGANGAATPTAVNKWGTIVGYYSVDNGYDSFLWKTSGTITTIVFPKMLVTVATGINSSGTVVGYYQSRTGAQIHGFLRNPKYVSLDAPFAGTSGGQGTEPLSINAAGEIAGVYWDSNSVEHGFILDTSGNYTSFDVPSDTAVISAYLSENGQVAGTYLGAEPNLYPGGYVMDTSGNITTVAVPGALYTQVYGINSNGEVAGQYYGAGGLYYGFVQAASGTITTFTVPGLVLVSGIADNGNVYGVNLTRTTNRGWKYTAAGVLSYYQDPDAGPSGTLPLCVSSNGEVVGMYVDSQGISYDFEMTN